MITALRKLFYWPNIKNETTEYLSKCLYFQQVKAKHQHPAGLLQPLPIPERKWESVSMDFITGIPATQGRDYIYVVVDRLTEYAHCFPITTTYSVVKLTVLFFREIFRLHGLPWTIVSDLDSRFLSHFWQEIFRLCGIMLTPSTNYHPPTMVKLRL